MHGLHFMWIVYVHVLPVVIATCSFHLLSVNAFNITQRFWFLQSLSIVIFETRSYCPPWWDEAFPQNPWYRWLNAWRRESIVSPPPSSETENPVAHGWSCPSRSSAPGWETLYVRIKEFVHIEGTRRRRKWEIEGDTRIKRTWVKKKEQDKWRNIIKEWICIKFLLLLPFTFENMYSHMRN